MEKYSKEYFKHLANQIMFDLSDQEVEELQEDFKTLTQQMELLNKIDTDDVEAMVYPFDVENTYLREDVVDHVISQEEALENAPLVKERMIVVPKVVK